MRHKKTRLFRHYVELGDEREVDGAPVWSWRCRVTFEARFWYGLVVVDWLAKCDGVKSIEALDQQRELTLGIPDRFHACKAAIDTIERVVERLKTMAASELAPLPGEAPAP